MTDIRVKKDAAARRFEMSVDIDAPADAVWNALTQADELTRWFPLEATVTPGERGSMHWGWRDAWSWGSKITAWEPNRHLQLVETRQAFDADGKVLDTPGANQDLVMDISLESRAGRTRVARTPRAGEPRRGLRARPALGQLTTANSQEANSQKTRAASWRPLRNFGSWGLGIGV